MSVYVEQLALLFQRDEEKFSIALLLYSDLTDATNVKIEVFVFAKVEKSGKIYAAAVQPSELVYDFFPFHARGFEAFGLNFLNLFPVSKCVTSPFD